MSADNLLTIDFEDWYQGLTSTSTDYDNWPHYESRINGAADWLLSTLARRTVKATFFIVGQVAEEHPSVVRAIADEGHEIALHGAMHRRVYTMTREQFARDLQLNAEQVESAAGKKPVGFRAPCFSVNADTPWVWAVEADLGLRFDSSIFPVRNPLYGMPGAARHPHRVETENGPIHEFPLTTIRALGMNLPFSGGFYFRFLPYILTQAITRRLNNRGQQVIFYFHPWEFDPDHPMPPSTTKRERLSHYYGLGSARSKFENLLDDFTFAPLGSALV